MLPVLSKRIVAPRCARSVASSAIAPAAASRGIIGLRPLLHQCGAPRSLATASEAPRQSFKTPLLAIAGCLLGSAALVSASADEEKHEALYSPKQVQLIAVTGPPLCGKATHAQRIGKFFDALVVGPEDDIFSEVAMGTAGGSTFRTCIQGWPRSIREAQWIEEELCPITAIVYIDVSPTNALKRTNERAASAVKSGHKLFHTISDELLEAYQKQGKLIIVDGNKSLEDTWKELESKLSEFLKKGPQ